MDAESQVELLEDVLEAPRLQSAGAGLGVAVHGIAYPQHAVTGCPDSLDRAWQGVLDVLRAEAVNQRQTPGLVLRIEGGHQSLQPVRVHRGADLDRHRVGDATEVFDMRPVELCGAHPDPRKVCRQVVPAILAWD